MAGKRKYSKMSGGAYIGNRRYVRRKVARKRYTKKKFGYRIPTHSFHRWITAFNNTTGTSFVNISNCTYDGSDSFITCTATQKECTFALAFQLIDIPNYTEFSNLFDSYMITGVMLQFKLMDNPDAAYPTNTSASSATANNLNWFPTIWYTPDHDDNNAPTLAQIKEYERVRHKVLRPNMETNIMLRPTTLTQLYRSSTSTGYAENNKRLWLDMANANIPHYGVKCVFDMEGLPPIGTFRIKVNAKYYFKCKTTR